jgi:CRISPR-associated protein Csx14
MAEARIPVDLFNPGQVFACLGFVEAAEILIGGAEGGFDWSEPSATRFVLRTAGAADPAREVLRFLAEAKVVTVVSCASAFDTSKWDKPAKKDKPGRKFSFEEWRKTWELEVQQIPEPVHPSPPPDSPDVLPARLEACGRHMPVEHWGDATRRDPFKLWAGAGGMPGAAILSRTVELVRDALRKQLDAVASDPFALATPQSSGFRLDWRRDYVALDAGFSANEHANIAMRGHPMVEIMAVIGLQNARPQRLGPLDHRYAVAAGLLPPTLLRAVLGAADLPLPMRRFRMRLGWPGQEGQARCILDAVEEG